MSRYSWILSSICRLLPAVTSGNDDVIRETLNQFTAIELAAPDDFMLSTAYDKSNTKGYVDKVEQAVRRWRVGQNGAAAKARFNDLQRQQENGSLQLMQGMRNWTGN